MTNRYLSFFEVTFLIGGNIMGYFDYLAKKHSVSPVFVEKLSFYNCVDELEQLVIDQINFQKNFDPRRDY